MHACARVELLVVGLCVEEVDVASVYTSYQVLGSMKNRTREISTSYQGRGSMPVTVCRLRAQPLSACVFGRVVRIIYSSNSSMFRGKQTSALALLVLYYLRADFVYTTCKKKYLL